MGFLTRCKRLFSFAFLLQNRNTFFSFFLKSFLILSEKQQLGYHVKQISSDRYTLLEHDSMAIKFDKSGMEYFIWNSRGIGGSVIDFAMAIHDVDKETAIKTLRNYLHSRTPEQIDDTNRRKKIQAAHSMKPKSLEMPPPCEGAFRKVYAYLSKSRGIEAEIVSSLMKNRQLYHTTPQQYRRENGK